MADHYRKLSTLGSGSFGRCYLVESRTTSKRFVIKQINIQKMTPDEKQQAIKEAQILKYMNHPNIIRFKDAFTTKKGHLCIVMEYADGGDLQNRLQQQTKSYIREEAIIFYFVQICLGIKYLHERHILHRDIKTQNIFLTQNNIVKIGDFGISKVLQDTLDSANTMIGSPQYLSPEMIYSSSYGFKSDIWALGIVLYELCSLHKPFEAATLYQLSQKIVDGKYQPIPRHYSRDLRHLVKKMLRQDPERRPDIHEILRLSFIKHHAFNHLGHSMTSQELEDLARLQRDTNQDNQQQTQEEEQVNQKEAEPDETAQQQVEVERQEKLNYIRSRKEQLLPWGVINEEEEVEDTEQKQQLYMLQELQEIVLQEEGDEQYHSIESSEPLLEQASEIDESVMSEQSKDNDEKIKRLRQYIEQKIGALKLHEVYTIVKYVDEIEKEQKGYDAYYSYLEHLLEEHEQQSFLPLVKALIHMEKST